MSDAWKILEKAGQHMRERAMTYDAPGGERSMQSAVIAFEAITDVVMTEEQGWLFMAILKAVRSQQGHYRADNYEDGAAYFALAGESAVERAHSWEEYGEMTPEEEEIKPLKNTPPHWD